MGLMDVGYRRVARPVIFRMGRGDAETAHHRTVAMLARIQRNRLLLGLLNRMFAAHTSPSGHFGLTFPNPIGLAAGADKDGLALRAWPALGFGFVEAGTVTAHAQPGNPTPRVFRLPESRGVINRMGFPNAGALTFAANCAATGPIPVPLGISLGKSKVTPVEEATEDYLASLRAVHDYADYIAVNVSSPNTPGLRGLQDKAALDELIATLLHEATALALARPGKRGGAPVPVLVKIAPDLSDEAIGDVLEVCETHGAAGIIAANTTVARPSVAPGDRGLAGEPGGLSGAPLAERALEVVRFVSTHTRLPVVGVGGITSPDDALRMFEAGAVLVQLYTGMLFEGPGLNRRIVRAADRAGLPRRSA